MKFSHMDHLNLNGNQIIIQLKIKYFIKKEIYNKDNNENILDKNDENDTNCE